MAETASFVEASDDHRRGGMIDGLELSFCSETRPEVGTAQDQALMDRAQRTPDQLAAEAKFLAVGLVCKLVRVEEAIAWAETVFAEQPSPPSWAMDISIWPKEHFLVIWARLELVSGGGGKRRISESAVRRLLGRVATAVDRKELTMKEVLHALEWLETNVRRRSRLAQELRHQCKRFVTTWLGDRKPKRARVDLRAWLEAAHLDE